MYFYVLTDEQGFITQISKQEQVSDSKSKWVRVLIPISYSATFVKYFDKFRIDSNGILLYPNNLPKVDSYEELQNKSEQQSKDLESLQKIVTDLTTQVLGGQL